MTTRGRGRGRWRCDFDSATALPFGSLALGPTPAFLVFARELFMVCFKAAPTTFAGAFGAVGGCTARVILAVVWNAAAVAAPLRLCAPGRKFLHVAVLLELRSEVGGAATGEVWHE
jgi:hypothetical protein